MITRMNMVQNAARLAMADHRIAGPLSRRRRRGGLFYRAGVVLATGLALTLIVALLAGFG